MRISILPLVIILLCSSVYSYSQQTCAGALPISTCTSATIGATQSGAPSATCSGTATHFYTWFSITTGTTCPAINFSISNGAQIEVAMFASCADLTPVPGSVACFTTGSGVWSPASGVAANNTTYFLRVWANTTSTTATISACNIASNNFDITGGCSTFDISNVLGVPTASGACAPNSQKNVTWVKFVSDGTCPMLSFDNSFSNPGAPVSTEVSLFSGCGNASATFGAAIAGGTSCVANGSLVWSPTSITWVAGNTYYLRVWTNSTNSGGRLNICNIPNTAQELPLDENCYDIDLSTNISGGTVSSIANCPSAATGNRRITWVKFHTTAAGNCVTVNLSQQNPLNTEMALYGGGCGAAVKAGTSVCFSDGKGVWSAGPSFPATGYTPNTDYYLRIYTDIAADGTGKTITLCGTEKTQAVNDLCSGAGAFGYSLSTTNNACAHFTTMPAEGLSTSGADAAKVCAFSLQNTVWYKFQVRDGNTPATVTISNIDCDSYNNSSQLLQMGLLKGNCGGLTPAGTAPAASGMPSAFPTNNTVMSPTSCLATNGAGPYNLYTSSTVTAGQIIYLAIDGYSGANCKFTLQASQNIVPIPIHLKYFTAWKTKSSNLIRWVTAWEHDNAYFEVERSIDGTNFESIGRVPGRTESTTDETYDLEDKFPPALAYYRLKQVDIDGKFDYSSVIQLLRDDNIQFAVSAMPNPIQNTARIAISTNEGGNVAMRVVDATGRQLMSDFVPCVKGNNIIMKDFSRLPSGTYYIAISQDGKRAVKTFVKQ